MEIGSSLVQLYCNSIEFVDKNLFECFDDFEFGSILFVVFQFLKSVLQVDVMDFPEYIDVFLFSQYFFYYVLHRHVVIEVVNDSDVNELFVLFFFDFPKNFFFLFRISYFLFRFLVGQNFYFFFDSLFELRFSIGCWFLD